MICSKFQFWLCLVSLFFRTKFCALDNGLDSRWVLIFFPLFLTLMFCMFFFFSLVLGGGVDESGGGPAYAGV